MAGEKSIFVYLIPTRKPKLFTLHCGDDVAWVFLRECFVHPVEEFIAKSKEMSAGFGRCFPSPRLQSAGNPCREEAPPPRWWRGGDIRFRMVYDCTLVEAGP